MTTRVDERLVDLELDPTRSNFTSIFGRKGSGKSAYAQVLWNSWPYDRIVVDPTGDVVLDDDTVELAQPLPAHFPVDPEGRRVSLRFKPDRLDPTYLDELDRAVGLAFYHPRKRCLCWLDEIHEVTSATKTPPYTQQALYEGRHRGLNLVMCTPRPHHVHQLVLGQADYVVVFDLPNPRDRQRVAEEIGWEPREFDAVVRNLPEHGYVRYDARLKDLAVFPPLPPELVAPTRARR